MGKYKRKSDKKLVFTEEIMKEVRERKAKGQSTRSIADSLNIPEATLRKRLKAGTIPETLGRFKSVFNAELAASLAEHCRLLDARFYGVTKKDLGRFAYELAEKNGLNHRFNQEKKRASKHWVESFASKHQLSLRQPEKTSLARAAGFNRAQVQIFYNNLKEIMRKYEIVGRQIFNMDETGLQTVPNKLPKVYAKTGKKIVGKIVSAERGQTVTAVCCMSASGVYVPPALIFPRKRQKLELMDGAPEDSLLLVSDSGYMNSDLFVQWLKHFIEMVRCSKDLLVLLILDNHSSHLSLEAIELARENGVILLSLPPHTSHRLQSLDTGFFGPLKKAYAVACDNWQTSNPARAITQFQVARLFGTAYSRVASIERAQRSFECCGVWPFNDQRFTDEDFAPADVTDRPFIPAETNETPVPTIGLCAESSEATRNVSEMGNSGLADLQAIEKSTFESNVNQDSEARSPRLQIEPQSNEGMEDIYRTLKTPDPPPSVDVRQTSFADDQIPSTSQFFKPSDIRPLPKSTHHAKRNSKRKKSEILTSTPYKNFLQNQEKEKEEKMKSKKTTNKKTTNKKTTKKATDKKNETTKKTPQLLNTSKRQAVISCPLCLEKYTEPPHEDWIQCSRCEAWWHAECTDYIEIGVFTCDNCQG